MSWAGAIKKNLVWLSGGTLTVVGFIFAEGWLIAAAKILGPLKATLFVSVITIPIAWIVIYLATKVNSGQRFKKWLENKEANLSKRAKMAAKSGKFIVILSTAVFLGPIIAAILMLLLGINQRRVYSYTVLCALLCAGIWCSFYAGAIWGLERIFWR
jgi:hypothetical protein